MAINVGSIVQRVPTWGDFGEDDQRGRINLLTSEKLKQGIAEVKEFQPFCLSLPLDLPGGNLLNPTTFSSCYSSHTAR